MAGNFSSFFFVTGSQSGSRHSRDRSSDTHPSKDLLSTDEIQLTGQVLEAIGKRIVEEKVYAPSLHSQIAVRWQDVAKQGLSDEDREKLVKKHPLPENCQFSEPPKLNPELRAIMQPAQVNRDARIINKQGRMVGCLAAITEAMSALVKEGRDLQDIPIIESLSDAIRLLADVHRDESIIRRSLIIANVNASLKDTLSETKISDFLFGDKLEDSIKSAKALQATARDLRVPLKTNSNKDSKNSKNPPRRQNKENSKTSGGQSSRNHWKKQNYNQKYDNHQKNSDNRRNHESRRSHSRRH